MKFQIFNLCSSIAVQKTAFRKFAWSNLDTYEGSNETVVAPSLKLLAIFYKLKPWGWSPMPKSCYKLRFAKRGSSKRTMTRALVDNEALFLEQLSYRRFYFYGGGLQGTDECPMKQILWFMWLKGLLSILALKMLKIKMRLNDLFANTQTLDF